MKKIIFLFIIFTLCISAYSQESKTLKGHTGNVLALAYSPDCKYIVSGGSDEVIIIWNIETGNIVKKIEPKSKNIRKIVFIGNSNQFITASSGKVGLADPFGYREERPTFLLKYDVNGDKYSFEQKLGLTSIPQFTINPNGESIFLCRYTGYEYLYAKSNNRDGYAKYNLIRIDCGTGEESMLEILKEEFSYKSKYESSASQKIDYSSYQPIAISPDNKYLAIGNCTNSNGPGQILIFRTSDNTFMKSINSEYLGTIQFSYDDKYIFGTSLEKNDEVINVYSIDVGKKIRTLQGHTKKVYQVSVYPNSKYIASASKDETVRIWDVETGKIISVLKGHTNDVNCLAFSRNGKYLATGSDDETVKHWDVSKLNDDFKTFILEFEVNVGLVEKLRKEMNEEIKLLDEKFKPKGEFETTEAYNTRISEANSEKKAIEEKYLQQLNELKSQKKEEMSEFKNQLENEKTRKIDESIKDTILHIDIIGSYNADKQTFEITIGRKTSEVVIPLSDAAEFKNNYKKALVKAKKKLNYNLTGWEYYDMIIINPNNNSEYIFK